MHKLKVLLLDDEPEVTAMMEMVLSKKAPDFLLFSLNEPDSCLEYITKKPVDCILSDYQMGEHNGIDVLREIRTAGNDTPYVFYTGQGNEAIAREAFIEGADDYFTKDDTFAQFPRLVNSIRQAVDKHRARLGHKRALAEWEETFNAIDDLITVHDTSFNIIRGNRAAHEVIDPEGDGITGRKCYELFHHHHDGPITDCPGSELVNGKACIITHRVDIRGGAYDVKVCPVVRNGRITSYVHIAKKVPQ